MARIGNAIAAALRLAIFAAFMTLIAAVLLQIVTRLWLPRSPVWTEELSRFALLYMVAIGGGLAMRTGDLVNVDLFVALVGKRWRAWLLRLVALGSVLFVALLIRPGWQFMSIGAFQTSPTLGVSMTWVFVTMVIAPIVLLIFAAEQVFTPPADRDDPE